MTHPNTLHAALPDRERYVRAMVAGMDHVCVAIEQRHGLYGYPPAIVCMGLSAIEQGLDPNAVIDDHLRETEDEA